MARNKTTKKHEFKYIALYSRMSKLEKTKKRRRGKRRRGRRNYLMKVFVNEYE